MSQEIWKQVVWYEWLYEVSSKWRVRSLYDGRWNKYRIKYLAICLNIDWYPSVHLSWKWNGRTFTVHRLVAIAFIENTHSLTEINHKDWDKTNNNVSNLEWSTRSRNIKHMWDNKLRTKVLWINHACSKIVLQYDINMNYIAAYWWTWDVYRILWFHRDVISACARWDKKTWYWFIWKYSSNLPGPDIQASIPRR